MKILRPDHGAPSVTAIGWLAGVVVFIAYGSLYPFEFSSDDLRGAAQAWANAKLQRPSRGDFAANIALYLPFGIAISAALPGTAIRWRVLAAVAGGAVLSFCIETLQWLEPTRFSSVSDVLLNIVGAGLGVLAASILGARRWEASITAARVGEPARVGIALVAVWILTRTIPWVPTLDLRKFRSALAPLLELASINPLSVLRHTAAWLVIALVLQRTLPSSRSRWMGLATLMLLVVVAQVMIVGRTLWPAEPAGMMVAAIGARVARSMTERQTAVVCAAMVSAAVILMGLQPFELATTPGPFTWVPLQGALSGNIELNLATMMEKVFFAASTLWLLIIASVSMRAATVAALVLWSGLEVAQRWLPGRTPEITDPLLVALAALAMARSKASTAHRNPAES